MINKRILLGSLAALVSAFRPLAQPIEKLVISEPAEELVIVEPFDLTVTALSPSDEVVTVASVNLSLAVHQSAPVLPVISEFNSTTELVKILNPRLEAIDVSGWSISILPNYGLGLVARFDIPSNVLIPPQAVWSLGPLRVKELK